MYSMREINAGSNRMDHAGKEVGMHKRIMAKEGYVALVN